MLKELDLDSYRRRAKELLKLAQAGDKGVHARLKRYNPDLHRSANIADVVAREMGFSSWLRFKGYVGTLDRSRKQSSPERLQSIILIRDPSWPPARWQSQMHQARSQDRYRILRRKRAH
jgi:hypothetical protein